MSDRPVPLEITTVLKNYGACPVCHRVYKLRKDGTMRDHHKENPPSRWDNSTLYCPGGGERKVSCEG